MTKYVLSKTISAFIQNSTQQPPKSIQTSCSLVSMQTNSNEKGVETATRFEKVFSKKIYFYCVTQRLNIYKQQKQQQKSCLHA